MTETFDASAAADAMRKVRQFRQYAAEPVTDEVLDQLLQVARWTGSSRNTQPWHFIVVRDPERLRALSEVRPAINWVAAAPVGIVLIMNGHGAISEAYDEGRVTERLMVAASFFGLGSGTAWFGDDAQQAQVKSILTIPAERTVRSMVAIGRSSTSKDPRPNPASGGRRPLADLVSYETFGTASL